MEVHGDEAYLIVSNSFLGMLWSRGKTERNTCQQCRHTSERHVPEKNRPAAAKSAVQRKLYKVMKMDEDGHQSGECLMLRYDTGTAADYDGRRPSFASNYYTPIDDRNSTA